MDRFFCVSTGFFRWKSIFHLFPSCCIRKFLSVFLRVYVSFSFYVCEYMRAHTRPREIHNVGLFPSVFESIKKRLPATFLFTAVYKKIFKFSTKKYCVKVAEPEKVRTFATAFERESR